MKMSARLRLLPVLFWIFLTGVRGEIPGPVLQPLNMSTPGPSSKPSSSGLVETPLPWPHPSGINHPTPPGHPSTTTPTAVPQGNITSGKSPSTNSTTSTTTSTDTGLPGTTPVLQGNTSLDEWSSNSYATSSRTPTDTFKLGDATATNTSNTSSWTIEPVGCYRDSYVKPRPLPELIADFRNTISSEDTNKTIRACAEIARERGFKIFGIQFYTECWSGAQAEETYGRDGISVDCQDGVGKSGANFVYRFSDYDLHCPTCEMPRSLCFPAVSRVTLESGASVSMRQLRVGDRVRTLGTNGETANSEVIAFLHKETRMRAIFYKLEISGGKALILSAQHLIFRKKTSSPLFSEVFASEVKLGDLLYISNGSASEYKAVTGITMVTETGIYAPLTAQGTLFVDGVLVSCYAQWPSHDTAHLAMAPLRVWKRLTGLIGGRLKVTSSEMDGISWYALALMALTGAFV